MGAGVGRSHWAIGFARLRRNHGAVAGAAVVLLFIAACALAPWLTDDDPVQVQFDSRFDDVVMRVVDLWLAFPGLVRLVRGTVLAVREQEFVDAARAVGGGDAHIIRAHIFPNVLAPSWC